MSTNTGVTGGSRSLEWLFYALTVIGFVGTQAQLPHFINNGLAAGTHQFWAQALSLPAGIFLTVDIAVLATAVFVWMFSEARRLHMRWVWIYFLGSLFIGISTFMPLFMGLRQRQLRVAAATPDMPLRASDWVGVLIAVLFALAVTVFSLHDLLS